MYIADDGLIISLDNLIYVAREDDKRLKFCYPDKTSIMEFHTSEERNAMFDHIVAYLCDDRSIVSKTEKAEPIEKEKVGYLIEKALLAAYENGSAGYLFSVCSGLGKHGEYKNATTAAKKCSDAVEDIYEALGTERKYLKAKSAE